MSAPKRGEVWLADLGIAAKVRPVVVVSAGYDDNDYALIGVIPHTTTPRGAQFEVRMNVPWLQAGAFNIQGMLAIPNAKFIRKIGVLSTSQLQEIAGMMKRWLVLE